MSRGGLDSFCLYTAVFAEMFYGLYADLNRLTRLPSWPRPGRWATF